MKIIRVFPHKTKCTPDDENVRINAEPTLFDEADEVHISVSFSWDLKRADELAKAWEHAGFNVKVGGCATGQREEEFVSGKYVKKGCVITSRGCCNHCWFCDVWKINGTIRELPIVDGYNVLDSNLLQCSEQHIRNVFAMLKRQKEKATFTGGLEAKRLKGWHCELLKDLKPRIIYFAYDTPDDKEPFVNAMELLNAYKVPQSIRRVYCLCGYKGDTPDKALERGRFISSYGAEPYYMFYRDKQNTPLDNTWRKFKDAMGMPQSRRSVLTGKSQWYETREQSKRK
jgi:hypothetical protein